MPKYIQYGDRKMDLPEGMTLDQAKEVMKRYFPELGDPVVKNEKQGDDTVYIFSKRAGRKGRGGSAGAGSPRSAHARAIRRLLRLPPAVLVTEWALRVAEKADTSLLDSFAQVRRAERVAEDLAAEAARARSAVSALRDAPGVPVASEGILL